jgi:hypothetical protein
MAWRGESGKRRETRESGLVESDDMLASDDVWLTAVGKYVFYCHPHK